MKSKPDLHALAARFHLYGDFKEAGPYGSGHINDTYAAVFDQGGSEVGYIFQRLNQRVFPNPLAVMQNIERVTTHVRHKLLERGGGPISRRVLTLVPTWEGAKWAIDPEGHFWRCYLFIENARTYDQIDNPRQAFEAAKAFGAFQKLLADLPAPRLHETIPGFHDTPSRVAALEAAAAADVAHRARLAQPEIEFALQRKPLSGVLLDAHLPERTTHNDTKFNNVMLDDETGDGVCVIDLDTVMPGLALYDFGDLVRTATSPTAEDERDLTLVEMQLPMFTALARGYLEAAGDFLTPAERSLLAFSGKLITYEIGVRFLTDFLAGDTYFKVLREGHNLDRCRTQFKLVESIEEQEEEMQALVDAF